MVFVITKIETIILPMYITSENDYPQLCGQVGLDCHTCVQATGRELAKACKGLRGKMIGQLFVQIHPHSACSKMHLAFARSYHEAAGELYGEPRAIAAVA